VKLGLPIALLINNNAASPLRALGILRAEHLLGDTDEEEDEEEQPGAHRCSRAATLQYCTSSSPPRVRSHIPQKEWSCSTRW
jgi:hypothetical protein